MIGVPAPQLSQWLPLVLILATPWLLSRYRNKTVCGKTDHLLWSKCLCVLYLLSDVLLHWPYDASQSTSAIIACVETVCVGILLYFQHLYDLKPPAGMSIYLTFGILVELTVAWSRFHASTFSTSAAFSFIGHSMPLALLIKTCLLGLHEKTKWSHLKEEVRVELTPKSTRGFWVQSLIGLCDAILLLRYTAADLDINAIGNFNPNLKTQTLVDMFEPVWENYRHSRHRLLKTIMVAHWELLFKTGAIQLLIIGLNVAYTMLIQKIVSLLEGQGHMTTPQYSGQTLIYATALLCLCLSILKAVFYKLSSRIKISVKGQLTAAIFSKVMTLPDSDTATATAISSSLITASVEGASEGVEDFDECWTSAVEAVVFGWMLWNRSRNSMLVTIAFSLATFSMCYSIAKSSIAPLRQWKMAVQTRNSESTKMIKSIRGIKMTGREHIMTHLMQCFRAIELTAARVYNNYQALRFAITISGYAMIPVIALAVDRYTTEPIPIEDTDHTHTAIYTLAVLMPFSRATLALLWAPDKLSQTITNFTQIDDFLGRPNTVDNRTLQVDLGEGTGKTDALIEFRNANIAATTEADAILNEICLSLFGGEVITLIGSSDVGKSTFLRAILGQSAILTGSVHCPKCPIGYSGQREWIQDGTIRETVIGYEKFDLHWYRKVLNACCLLKDIGNLPGRDTYVVGKNGVQLSDSIRQRLLVARAVYSRSSILLLDDVLSSQDQKTAEKLLYNLFGSNGLVKEALTVLACTQPPPRLDLVSRFLYLDTLGVITPRTREEIMALVDDNTESETEHADQQIQESVAPIHSENEVSSKEIVSFPDVPNPLPRPEPDRISYLSCLRNNHWSLIGVWILLMLSTTIMEDFFYFYAESYIQSETPQSWIWTICFVISALSGPFSSLTIIISPENMVLPVAPGLIYLNTSANVLSLFFNVLLENASLAMHSDLVEAVLSAPFSFFNADNQETVTKLFGSTFDEASQGVPRSMFHVLYASCTLAVRFGLAVFATPSLALFLPIAVLILFALQRLNVRILQNLQRIKSQTSSNLYSGLTDTINGLAHIHALQWRDCFLQRNWGLIDRSQQVSHSILKAEDRTKTAIDIITMMTTTLFVALVIHRNATPLRVGLAILVLKQANYNMLHVMNNSIKLDLSMPALNRIHNFVQTTPRALDGGRIIPPVDWLSKGDVELEGTSIKLDNDETVLQNVSLTVRDGESIGIHGPHKSGKTYLALSLLNLVRYSGSIRINGLEARTIPRQYFQSKITIIPQNPVTFPGTIRQNLIPDEILLDEVDEEMYLIVIEHILDRLDLLNVVYQHGDLSTPLADLNLSWSQLQRFSLAQALLHHFITQSKLIIINSATSNVDGQTRRRMQELIIEIFSGSSIIATARHRSFLPQSRTIGQIEGGQIHVQSALGQ